MKTAISLPDSLFAAADDLAKKLGISCSLLCQRAVEYYLKTGSHDVIRESPDEVYAGESARAFDSRIRTVPAAVVTGNLTLAKAPGYVGPSVAQSGLPKVSVVDVSQIVTLDKSFLFERDARLDENSMRAVDAGLRLVLSLR